MTDQVSLRFELGQLHLVFGDVSLLSGYASHRLTIKMKATATWLDGEEPTSNTPIMLTGTLWTDHPGHPWLAALQPQVLGARGYMASEELCIDLSDDQLIALERARGGDDVSLRLNLQATLLQPPVDIYPIAEEQVPVRIRRTRWMELLDDAGSEVGIVIRVPSPLTDPDLRPPPTASAETVRSYTQATARLRQARAELGDGQWEQCVATCRKVLENIELLVELPTASSVENTPSKQRGQGQRWAAIHYAVKSMTHAASHDDNSTSDFSWSRADAETILAATAGLLARCTTQ